MSAGFIEERSAGVLAGNGVYPFLLAQCLLKHGHRVPVAGIKGHFNGILPQGCGPVSAFPLGAFRDTAEFFLGSETRRIFLAGGITRKNAWLSARPDRHSFRLLPAALWSGDDALLKSTARVFSNLGIEVCDPRPYIEEHFAGAGLMAGPEPDAEALESIEVAVCAARKLGMKDKGQSAIALRRRVVKLEDRRGTDAMLDEAPGPGAVMAKVQKPGQDPRFDAPAIGPSTALKAHEAKLTAIAAEAGGVLLLERERLFQICNDKGISLVGI